MAPFLYETAKFFYLKIYKQSNGILLYDPETGLHSKEDKDSVIALIAKHFEFLKDGSFRNSLYLEQIYNNLAASYCFVKGIPEVNLEIIALKNCLVDARTLQIVAKNINNILHPALPFDFAGNGPTPVWFYFLDEITGRKPDVVQLIRAMIKLSARPDSSLQKFFYLFGKGNSGKSTLVRVMQALLPTEQVVASNAELLNNNDFEIANLDGKSLLIIADQKRGVKDYTTIKQLTGDDIATLRKKNVQGAFDKTLDLTIVIVSNTILETVDEFGNIERRAVLIPFNFTPVKPILLLASCKKNKWRGPLKEELPFIKTWALQMTDKEVTDIMENPTGMVPSLVETNKAFVITLDPVYEWIVEEIEPEKGAYVGLAPITIDAQRLLARNLKYLYPYIYIY